MWYEGLLAPSLWQLVAITLGLMHITLVTVTVFLHRHSAHRSVDLHPALVHFFRFWLWLTTGMVTREWTAVHRKHHALCETEEDPHSPQVMGLKKILFEGAEAYGDAVTEQTCKRYGRGCPDDWIERNLYTPYNFAGVTLMAVLDLALFGVAGIVVWGVQMLCIPVLAAGVINGVGHYWGYRNFECPDAATNIVPWGIIIGGEELHNNHHTFPNSAKFSVKPWEFDLGWKWVQLFQWLGLAKVRSTGPVVARDPAKSVLDRDTAWALVNDRFRVMARYSKEVIGPMVRHERKRSDDDAREVLRRSKRVLSREPTRVSAVEQQRLNLVVDRFPELETIYQRRLELHAIWKKRAESADALLEALSDWCRRAEESGITVLRDFAAELKSYTMPNRARAA